MDRILKSNIPYQGPQSENLVEFIKKGLSKNLYETILIDTHSGRKWDGRELIDAISKLSSFLMSECGLKKGDVCSLYGEENDEMAILILAVICAGCVSNFLTTKSSGREVHDTAKVLGSKALFVHNSNMDRIQSDVNDLADQLKVVYMDSGHSSALNIGKILVKDCLYSGMDFDQLLASTIIEPELDYAVVQFSSGTTGKPKPIPRTHKNLCHLVASVDHEELMDMKPGVVITGSIPLTHRPGIWALLACVNGGSTMVVGNNVSTVRDAFNAISLYRVTIFSSSLPFLSVLGNSGIKLKGEYDLSSLEHIITSGAKIVNPDLPATLVREFGLKSLRQCFGMTESGWTFLIEQSLSKDAYLTVGHIVPGMEAVILERESKTIKLLGPNLKGEIALRGPQVFPGYLTDKPGNLNRSDFTDEGWFRIGDQAYFDENELVFIEGRYKEVMMFENNCLYFPTEIEGIITEHSSIEGACVVKIAEIREDYPYDVARAYVTLKHDKTVTEQELLEFVQEKSPQVILGGGIRVLDKFPRLQNGKVDKQTLKTMK